MKKNLKLLFCSLFSLYLLQPVEALENQIDVTSRANSLSLSAYIDDDTPTYLIDSNSNNVISDYWEWNEVKTLHLDADLSGANNTGKFIDVKLPVGMKLNSAPSEFVNGVTISSVDTSKYRQEKISSSNSGVYTPNCGTVRFNISENTQSLSIDLLVSIDYNFWDTVNNSPAVDSNKKAIEVTIGDSNSNVSKKLDMVYTTGRTWGSYLDTNVPSYIETDTIVTISNYLTMDYVQKKYNRLYREATTKVDIPYTIKNENGVNVKKYAEVKNISISYGGSYEIIDNQIIITYKNAWLSNISYSISLNFNSSIFKENDLITYQYGDLDVKNYFTSKSTKLLSMYTKNIQIAPSTEKVQIASSSINAFNNKNENVISHLGYFLIRNNGALSAQKRITFDFPSGINSGIGVTTVRIPTNTSAQTLKIDCILWEKDSNKEYTGTITINKSTTSESSGYLLTVSTAKNLLNLNNKELYFKQVKYLFGKIPLNYISESRYSGHSPSSSGNTWGKIFLETTSGSYYTSSMTVESLDDSNVVTNTIKTSQNTTISSSGQAPAYVGSFNYYDTNNKIISEINSGRDFSIKGNFGMASYPYTNTGYMAAPIILIKVPEGLTIDKNFTKFTSSSNTSKSLDYRINNESTPRKLSNGEVVYEIEILNQGFGYYTENLGGFNSINYEIRFNISKLVKTTALNGRGLISIEDKYVKANAGGSFDAWYITDTWDVNNNGSKSDRLATISNDLFLNINSNTNCLDTDFFVSVNNSDFIRDSVTLMSPNDKLTFKFSIDNIHGGYVPKGEFEYTLTIPKNDKLNYGFSLELDSFIEEVNGFEILYSNDGQNYLAKNSIGDKSTVRYIKIKSTIQIEDNFKHDFLINLKYTNGSYNKKSFSVSSMVSGYQTYKKGTSSNSIYQILDSIYTFIDSNSEKPTITEPLKNNLYDLNRTIRISWTYTKPNLISRSVIDILNSENKKVNSININSNFTSTTLNLGESDTYQIIITSYNLFDIPSTSDTVSIRVGIYNTSGNLTSTEIALPNNINYLAIIANQNIPSGTNIVARVYFTTNTLGNVVISDKTGAYIDIPIYNKSVSNPIPTKLPKSTSKIKVRFLLQNNTNPKNLTITPSLESIQVLAK